MGATGICFTMITPILVGSVVDGLGFGREMIGGLSAVNIFGLAAGAGLATVKIGNVSLLKLIRLSCIGLIIFELISFFIVSAALLLTVRAFSGVAGGVLYASALASFSVLKNPRKAFGLYIVCYALLSLSILFFLPLIIEVFDYRINFAFLLIMAVISLSFSGIVTRFEDRIPQRSFDHILKVLANKKIAISMTAYFLLQLSGGLMFTYSERIGVDAGLSTSTIGLMLSLSSVFSILGAFLVIRVSQKFRAIPQVILFGFLMMMSMVCLFYSENTWIFFLGLSLLSISWSYLLPFHQQNQSSYDELGRVVSVGSVVNMMGRATGPALGAAMLGSAAFENVLWISIITVIISITLFSFVLR